MTTTATDAPVPADDTKITAEEVEAAVVVSKLRDAELYQALLDTLALDTPYARVVRRLVLGYECHSCCERLAADGNDKDTSREGHNADVQETISLIKHLQARELAYVRARYAVAIGGNPTDARGAAIAVLRDSPDPMLYPYKRVKLSPTVKRERK